MRDRIKVMHDSASEARSSPQPDRRQFLRLCGGAVAAVGVQFGRQTLAGGQGASAAPAKLPTVRIGKYELTRLIVGSNPVEGYSHSSVALSEHMREYFTLERTVEFITRCEQMGINTWQSGHGPSEKVLETLRIIRDKGSRIHWLCLGSKDRGLSIRETVSHKPIAIVHHGGVTDSLFRKGEHEKVHDYIKKVHDAGIMAGVSTHNPAVVAYIEEKGWENEFFMACLYQVSRPQEEIRKKLGTAILDEPFLESDRDEMTVVIRKVKRPCLAFKILAAGRLCRDTASVEAAFQYAYGRIKPSDAVIVGMYPKFSDEIATNVQFAKHYGQQARPAS